MRNILLIALSLCVMGCQALAPAVGAVKSLGVTEGDRRELLEPRIKLFHNSLRWGKTGDLLAFATQEYAPAMRDDLMNKPSDEKVVDSKTHYIDFSEESKKAEVVMVVRFYRIPYYVVTERREKQQWLFVNPSSGWKLSSREILKK